jgi:hypothetical protein
MDTKTKLICCDLSSAWLLEMQANGHSSRPYKKYLSLPLNKPPVRRDTSRARGQALAQRGGSVLDTSLFPFRSVPFRLGALLPAIDILVKRRPDGGDYWHRHSKCLEQLIKLPLTSKGRGRGRDGPTVHPLMIFILILMIFIHSDTQESDDQAA